MKIYCETSRKNNRMYVILLRRINRSLITRLGLLLIGCMFLIATPAWTQSQPERKGFWADVLLGYGFLNRSSDHEPRKQQDTFAMAFDLGGTFSRYVRFGLELNGWLLEANDDKDPAKGVSVSQTFFIAQVYPWPARGLFVKLGAGRADYTNHHPFEFGSSGRGVSIGSGYDLPVSKNIWFTPHVDYCRGSLGSVENQLTTVHNRRYHVFSIGIALTFP
jgi:hypothetical protein